MTLKTLIALATIEFSILKKIALATSGMLPMLVVLENMTIAPDCLQIIATTLMTTIAYHPELLFILILMMFSVIQPE